MSRQYDDTLCSDCKVAPLDQRRNAHLLLFMHKQLKHEHLLKEKVTNTKLQMGPVFDTYKPNNEKNKTECLVEVQPRGMILMQTLQT